MEDKYEHIPFPDIPILREANTSDSLSRDEEQNVYFEYPQDVYTGAPESALDSVQLQPEYSKEVLDGVSEPLLKLAREYSRVESGESTYAKTSSTEFGAARETLEFILNNPEHISMSLKYLGEIDPLFDLDADTLIENTSDLFPNDITLDSAKRAVGYIKEYVGSNYQDFISRNNSEQYSDDTIHDLFHSIATEGNSLFEQETAEGILKTYLAELDSADDCTHVLYELCAEAMNSGDPNKVRYAVDLMAGKTSLMKFGDDVHLKLHSTTFSASDTSLRESGELAEFFTAITPLFYPEEYEGLNQEQIRYTGSTNPYSSEAAHSLALSDPDRLLALQKYLSADSPDLVGEASEDAYLSGWPTKMFYDQEGPLSRATKAYSARYDPEYIEQGLRYVQMPGDRPDLFKITEDRKPEFLANYIEALRTVEPVSEQDRQLNGLQFKTYLESLGFDYYSPENVQALKQYERTLKLDLTYHKERILSQRGVIMEITDPVLEPYEMRSIEFYRDTDVQLAMQGAMTFRLNLGNFFVEGNIDEKGNVSVPDLPNETLNIAKTNLTLIVANHAHEILCLKDHELDDLQDDESRRSFEADSKRSMHRRLLPEGDGPTKEQMEVAAQYMWAENIELANLTSLRQLLDVGDNDPRDQFELRDLAKELGVDKNIRLYTFVRETPYSEDELKNLPPIRIKSVQGRIHELGAATASGEAENRMDGGTNTAETEVK